MTDLQAKRFAIMMLNAISIKYDMEHPDWRFRHRRPGIPEQYHYPEVNIVDMGGEMRLPPRPRQYREFAALEFAARVVNPEYYGRVTIVP